MKRIFIIFLPAILFSAVCGMEKSKKETQADQFLDEVKKGNLKAVQDLLKIEHEPEDLTKLLLFAVKFDQAAIVSELLQDGANPNVIIPGKDFNVFHFAIVEKKPKMVALLLEAGADQNRKNLSGETPLMLAVYTGSNDIVKKLLEAGANTQDTSQDGYTALDIANGIGEVFIASLLRAASKPKEEFQKQPKKKASKKKVPKKKEKKKTEVSARPVEASKKRSMWQDVEEGNLALLKAHLENPNALKAKNSQGETLLIVAATLGHQEIIDELLCRKVALNEVDAQGNTALMRALENQHLSVAKSLLLAGANPNIKNKLNYNALSIALLNQPDHLIEFLIEKGADPKQRIGSFDNTLLMEAIKAGQFDIAKYVADKVDINAKNNQEKTALMFAVEQNRPDFAVHLIRLGASLEERDLEENSVLDYALKYGKNSYLYQMLINEQKQLAILQSPSELFNAVIEGNQQKLSILLKQEKVDINSEDKNGDTPLAVAIQNDNASMVKLLLSYKPKLNTLNKSGLAAIHIAVMKGRPEMVSLLIENGANVNIRDQYRGRTPLHWVVRMSEGSVKKVLRQIPVGISLDLIDILLKAKADKSIRDKEGKTALDWAKIFQMESLVKKLEGTQVALRKKKRIGYAVA